MQRKDKSQQIIDLLSKTQQAHKQAHPESAGENAEWPIWYAEFMAKDLSAIIEHELTASELTKHLIEADEDQCVLNEGEDWMPCYADFFLNRYLAEPDEKLILYYFNSCPFCQMVLFTIKRLGVEVEYRDISKNREYHEELIAARGRGTVPVLRCISESQDRWMPESRDINEYLKSRFG